MTADASGAVPDVVVWEATRACRFACRHCRAKAQPEPDPDQLRGDEVRQLFEDIASFAKPILIVSGGDAMLREDLFELLSYADSKSLKVVLSLSGRAIDVPTVERLRACGVRRVSISLDAPTPEAHDSFRGVPGAFHQAMECIESLKEAGMPFQVNTTVSRLNVRDIDGMRRTVEGLGAAAWDLFFLVPTGRATADLELPKDDYERVLGDVIENTCGHGLQTKATCAPQSARIAAARGYAAGRRGCLAGKGFCFVSHTGDVYGCGFLPVSAGNIRERDFRTIYQQSELFQAVRDAGRLGGKCGRCEHRSACGGCRARAFAASGDVLAEDPGCAYVPGR